MHKDLQDIPPEYFILWNETLGYERGLPHFRQPPEFSEEGVLVPTAAGGYTYQQLRRLPMPASSQLSPTGHVEFEDNPPPTALPPSQNQYDLGGLIYYSLQQQTPSTSPQSTSSQPYGHPSGEDSSYEVDNPINPLHSLPDDVHESPHYVYAEPLAMEGITSAPYNMQMTSPQQDVQMAEFFWLGSL